MLDTIYNKLKTISLWNLLWISLVLVEVFTAIMNTIMGLIWYGRIDINLLLIGTVDAFVVGLIVTIILILIFREIRNYEGHSEEAILKAKEEWELTFNSMSDLIMILDTKHKVVRTNKAMAEKLKMTPAATVGITCYEHVHGLSEPPSFCPHSLCMLDGQEHSVEIYQEGLGGHYLVTVTPLFNTLGKVIGSVHTAKDITERKRMERLLRESEDRLGQAVRVSQIGIFDHDHRGDTIYWSPEQRKTYGWGAEDTVNLRAFLDCVYPEDRERISAAVRRSHDPAGNGLFDVEHRIIRRDDEVRWLSTRSQTFFEGDGDARRPVRTVGATLDITERKQAEKSLRENETFLQTIIETEPECIKLLAADGALLLMNRAGLSMIEADSLEQVKGQCVYRLVAPDYREAFKSLTEDVFTGKSGMLEFEAVGLKGRRIWLNTHAVPLRNDKDEIIALLGITRDVTEHKRAEISLKEMNAKLQALINTIPDMVVFKDIVGRHVVVNRAVEAVTGHSRDEITGKTIEELLPPDPAAACRKSDEEAMRQSVPTHDEERIVQRDGSVSYFDMVKAPMTDDRGAVIGLVAVGRDITGRKQLEWALRESEEKFRNLFDTANDAVFILGLEGNFIDVNRIAHERLGYAKEEMLSLHVSKIDPPEFASRVPERFAQLRKEGYAVFESAHLRKDGAVMPVEINAKIINYEGRQAILSIVRDITDRKKYEETLRNRTQQLEDLTRDLEKRVAAEIRVRIKNERMMIQQSKLAAMGEMLGAIAHQWRQPLNVVGLIVQNMEDAYAFGKLDKEYLEKTVEKAMAQILRMSKTIDDFRGFYKPDKEKTVFDAMRAVGDVLSLVSAQLVGDGITYRLTCHTHGKTFENEADIVCCAEKTITGFKNEFEHVILNLVNNARDAILEKRAHRAGAAEKGLLSLDFYNAGGTVVIKASDNGGGIPPEAISRIFDPYFTTKEPTKGTGLGLYISKVIVEDHMAGTLSVENADGCAIFTIELPRSGNGANRENTEAV